MHCLSTADMEGSPPPSYEEGDPYPLLSPTRHGPGGGSGGRPEPDGDGIVAWEEEGHTVDALGSRPLQFADSTISAMQRLQVG